MITRREFTKTALAAVPLIRATHLLGAAVGQLPEVQKISSTIDGVRLGVQTASFSFSGIGIDGIIKTMWDVGLAETDVMSEHVENFLGAPVLLPGEGRQGPWVPRPPRPAGSPRPTGGGFAVDPVKREALRQWRLNADLAGFRSVNKKFVDAGLSFFSYNLSFDDNYSDAEIDKGFEMAKALGTKIITASSPVAIFPRLKPFAEKHDMIVAIHNHVLTPDDFKKTMDLSPHFWVNLDVGHFFATGYDPVAYITEHHDRITNIHIKDRNKNFGAEMPFGDGETPLSQVLLLLKKQKYNFPACIEYVGPSGPAIELSKCLQYCKDVIKHGIA